MDASHLREHVVRPALRALDLYSQAAENLVMGTAAQESHLEYLVQLGNGPARGIFQMEPATHDDIWKHWLGYQPELANALRKAIATTEGQPPAGRMVWDLRYAAMMCRIHYRRVPSPLPDEHDVHALAAYWKEHYNTHLGAGTVQEFVDNYRRVA